jgi:hypothetical protein
MSRLLSVLVLAVNVAAWDECHFPHVDYIAHDEGVGKSAAYGIAAMNGNMYSGGYSRGNFAFVGGKADGVDVNPDPCATLWGTTHSSQQNIYIAEVSSEGQMTKGWHFIGSGTDAQIIGYGDAKNAGMHRMLDNAHLAVSGRFSGTLTLPDGTVVDQTTTPTMKPGPLPFILKFDVSSDTGVGTGTTGWFKQIDLGYEGGATVHSVDGDASGNFIIAMEGCASWNASVVGCRYGGTYPNCYYGYTMMGAAEGCAFYVKQLSAADGSELYSKVMPTLATPCRPIADGSVFCGFQVHEGMTYDFGDGVTLTGSADHAGIVMIGSDGVTAWAKETVMDANYGGYFGATIAVNSDGSLLALATESKVARIDTSSGNEGNVLWEDSVPGDGMRGVEVTHEPDSAIQEVHILGQVSVPYGTGTVALTDTAGVSTMLRARGLYDAFTAAYDAADGAGKYAIDLGGDGIEWAFQYASDPTTDEIYIGTYSRSENIYFGDIIRDNQMHEEGAGSSDPVGGNKAVVYKFKTTTELPYCVSSCDASGMTVVEGHCYIDRHCYAHGEYAAYDGAQCMHCNATNPDEWAGPDTTNHCFIDGKCYDQDEYKSGSACESCQPSMNTMDFSMSDGWAMVDGACHEHTWDELAAAAGWNPPCERRRRKLSAPKRFPARGFKRQLSAKQAPRKDEM